MSTDHVVVVLSYRGREDTLRCLDSLAAEPVQVLVVDNGSGDGVLEAVQLRHPGARTHQTGRNLGFAGGMDAGLRLALGGGAQVVTVLNNDTVVEPGAMRRLERTARRGLLVSPEVFYLGGPDELWFAGGVVDPETGLARHLSADELSAPGTDGLRDSEVLSGCCLTASAETWSRTGLFDETYFLDFEDSELSLRARSHGVRLVVDTRARIRHAVSASFTGDLSVLGLYYYSRNGLRFVRQVQKRDLRTAARFLREHCLPQVVGPLRRRDVRTTGRAAVVLGWAVADQLRGRSGPAPMPLQALARRWGR